ncbi:MAG: tetratricopeptide repeat protein [Betaproteobacteria bacterium]|nr:tetratricopeptide repeat protein [Betaproteobacteria bacterium]
MPFLRHALLLLCALVTLAAQAQAPELRELSVDERARYAAALSEASALLKESRYAEAVAKLDALLAQRPREPQARFLRAVADADQGRTDEAVTALRALVADYPELPEPWNNLAVIHAQKGDYESARVALEAAVQAAPNWSVAQENLGDVYARLAAAAYDRAARGDRDNKTAGAKLAVIREMFAPARTPAR